MAWKINSVSGLPLELLTVKDQVPGVSKKFGFVLVIVPMPVTFRNLLLCCSPGDVLTMAEVRLNVNPSTDQSDITGPPGRGEAGVPRLKVQVPEVIVTGSLMLTFGGAKEPVPDATMVLGLSKVALVA